VRISLFEILFSLRDVGATILDFQDDWLLRYPRRGIPVDEIIIEVSIRIDGLEKFWYKISITQF
jgi:hypothetical protein